MTTGMPGRFAWHHSQKINDGSHAAKKETGSEPHLHGRKYNAHFGDLLSV